MKLNFEYLNSFKKCVRCVMDTSDPYINFDENGICDYCSNYDQNILPRLKVKTDKSNNPYWDLPNQFSGSSNSKYDCIVGLSGGLDSSYLLHLLVTDFGLKPLAVHVNAGWDNAHACHNIRSIVDGLKVDLHTIVIDWESMREIQFSFMNSGYSFLDVPQDMAFFSELYYCSLDLGIKDVITGANNATEAIREPSSWGAYPGNDPHFVKMIFSKYSRPFHSKIDFRMISSISSRLYYPLFYGMRVHKPLNFLSFSKSKIENELLNLYGWKPYTFKHHESIFTKFLEAYWLPMKFGIDRRKAHLSSLIFSNEISREDAVNQLFSYAYPFSEIMEDYKFVADKLECDIDHMDYILKKNNNNFSLPYRTKLLNKISSLQNFFSREKRLYR